MRSLMRLVSLAAPALVVTVTVGGCGGSSPLSIDDLAPEIIAASCRISTLCGESPDETTCAASTQIRTSLFETLKADIQAGIVRYDGRAARACVDVYAGIQACTYTEVFRVQSILDNTCGHVFTGTLPQGANCFFNEECANHGTCNQTQCTSVDTCCVGTCSAGTTVVPAGSDCSLPDTECAPGTRCVVNLQTVSALICAPTLAGGAACSTTASACALPFACVAPDPTVTAGICTPPPGTGEVCGNTDLGTICNALQDVCDTSTFVCVRRTPAGGACSATTTAACVPSATCDGATCVARGGPGAACDPALLTPCLGTMECDVTNHCTLPAPGASCR